MLLDCELMPWSVKAQELLSEQYAAVGAAARAGLTETVSALQASANAGVDVGALHERFRGRVDDAQRFVEAYRHYCWPVRTIDDVKLAPFHLLASASAVHVDKDHVWHMQMLSELCAADPLLHPTAYTVVDTTDADSQQAGCAWWAERTEHGGKGMVVKPFDYVARGRRGLAQPALKTRGREYLRIIYGPDYTEPANLDWLRERGLGTKRSLALREFALGIEALERFVRDEPHDGCTSACSACSRWRASPWTRGCKDDLAYKRRRIEWPSTSARRLSCLLSYESGQNALVAWR